MFVILDVPDSHKYLESKVLAGKSAVMNSEWNANFSCLTYP
jgi:hypothetical protein